MCTKVHLQPRGIDRCVLGNDPELMGHAHQMSSHLEPEVGMLERADAIVPPAVLRTDELLEDIQVCGFDARSQSVAHALWERADLGDDPTKEVRGQQDGGRLADASRPFGGAGCACCELWDRTVALALSCTLSRGGRLPRVRPWKRCVGHVFWSDPVLAHFVNDDVHNAPLCGHRLLRSELGIVHSGTCTWVDFMPGRGK